MSVLPLFIEGEMSSLDSKNTSLYALRKSASDFLFRKIMCVLPSERKDRCRELETCESEMAPLVPDGWTSRP